MRSFAWRVVVAVMAALSAGLATAAAPNVVVILADDLGFSDLGCYGSEIDTPHLDRLAAGGLRFTQGYNTARCWPSRASVLTGYYPQAIRRDALPGATGGMKGGRPAWARLLPQLLAPAGYRSYHSGKWHVDGDPRKQGFDRSLQIEGGQNDYFDPAGITVDGRPIGDREGFYITTVVGEHAAECLRQHAAAHPDKPFFSYVAFTSPHFPLHAPQDLVAKYRARYAAGWDAVQQARVGRIRAMGLVTSPPASMERDVGPPYRHAGALALLGGGEVDRPLPWDGLTGEQREFQITKMAIHAAMIDAMDQAVGKIVAQLEAMAALDDTLILFASDNGASAEIMVRGKGHDQKLPAGGPGTYLCLGPGWSSCANTPFRRHKTWVHEGGIATPWIAHWPKGIATRGGLRAQPVHVVDVAPTVLELAGVEAPAEHDGGKVPPMQGRSFAAALRDASAAGREEPLWWCHEGHRAVRVGDWKLVAAKGTPWELYDLSSDRCETKDLASAEPARVESLEAAWNRIADECRSLAAPVDRGASKGPRPPNVVIIFCDDLGYGDPGCYGGTAAPTPNIDRLAREGIRFTDFHVAQAVCSASRAALLTGCYPNRLGIHGALGPKNTHGIAADETTLAELLRDRGYRTACVGKWHLGHHPPFLPTRHGFDEYFGLPYSNDMWPHHPAAKPGTFPPLPLFENETVIDPAVSAESQSTLTARYVERAVSFIERAGAAADGRPFFLYLAHSMPHVPLFVGRAFRGTSAGGLYGDVLAEIDASVGAVLAAVDKAGRTDDTLVLFTSDNGPWLSYGDHAGSAGGLREGKGTAFEGGVRVPCVARLPGRIPSGTVSGEPLMTIDLLPSIARLTGEPLARDASGRCLVAGRPIDGHDRLDLLCGGSRTAGDTDSYLFYYRTNELHAVRQGPWKLFFPHEFHSMEGQVPGKEGMPGAPLARRMGRSLHHLVADRAERRDVAAEHPEVVARLETIAEAARADLGDRLAARSGSGSRSPGTLPRRRPNIVFFLCDDLGGGDIAALGSKHIRTPNIDALFARGTRLSRHWAGCAVCAPSRCVLMTGKHPGHAVVRSNREVKPEGQAPMPAGTVTLARLLKDAGYATGGFGKWGLGAPGSVSDPIACGFDEFFGYNCQRQAHSFYPDHLWNGRERVELDGKTYSADLIAERQLAFIRAHTADPFFLYVPTTVPHLALQVPDDEPSLAEYAKHFGDEEPYLGGRGYQPCRRPLATYAAMITRMDREVGRIVKLLEELKVADDTIFVFSSDNGATWPGIGGGDTARLKSNGPLRDWKGSPYEGGLRVPTVAVWPGRIPAGKVIDAPSGFEDWLPTLLDLAGLRDRVPSGLDGVSLAGALRGEAVAPQERVLYRELTEARWQAAIDGRWKAIRKAPSRKQPETALPIELYDLAADPSESRDVASERPEVVARLEAILDREHVPDPAWPLPFADVGGQSKKAAAAKPEARRPNILYIIVDDQSPFDFRFYNPASTLQAPVIERLAAEGMVFDAAYHMGSFSGAVCTPSRHMVMSGRSVWHLPIGPNTAKRKKGQPPQPQSAPHCPPGLERFTMAPIFNAAGYDTMRTCKVGNAYEAADKLFTVRRDATRRGGTNESGSVWHGDQVMDYLAERERTKDADPFLIYFGFSHPHDTRDGTPELLAKYGAKNHTDESRPPQADPRQPPLPPNWLPKHPFDNTDMRVRDERSVSGVWGRRDEATVRNELGREYACSENIDRQIGRVLDKLEAMGELDNTWIFYTADHGIAIGRHGLQGKQNLYEHTWRVPFIVKGPGVRAGSRVPGNIYLGDSLATLCDIAGIPAPDTSEGSSFRPVLEGRREAVRDVLYGVYCGGTKPGMRSVRKGAWKILKYESPEAGLHTQLFNLEENPHEFLAEHHDPAVAARLPAPPAPGQGNLADDPAHAAKRSEMEALLLAEMRRHDDPFRFSDQLGQPDSPDQPAGRARVPAEASR